MLVYILLAIASYLLLYFSKKMNNDRNKKILICTSFIIIFLVSALRVKVGTDYNSYLKWFNNVTHIAFGYENFAFNLMIAIIKLFTTNPQWLFILSSFFILIFVYVAIFKEQEEYDMSIFLFIILGFYFSTFNGIRQWMAGAIFMFAYYFAKNKKITLYILLIFIASLFHITALLLLPFYFIFNLKVNDKIKIITLLCTLLIFSIFDFISVIAFFLKTISINFYWRYISSGIDLKQGVGSFFPIIICGGMFIYYVIFKKKYISVMDNKKYNDRKNLAFILTFFSIINTSNNLFSRFSLYFIPMIMFLLPDAYLIFEKKYIKYIKIIVIIFGIAYMVVNTLMKNSNNPLPYHCVFW